jgi:hypothetical protein
MVETNKAMTKAGWVLVRITDSQGLVVFCETIRDEDLDSIVAKLTSSIR